jgi:hypothetical protein
MHQTPLKIEKYGNMQTIRAEILFRFVFSSVVRKMEVVALVSGGKDSCMSMLECVRAGHRIVALANLLPPPSAPGT